MSIASDDLKKSIPVSKMTNRSNTWRSSKRSLHNIVSLDDFEEPARRYIPRPIFGYIKSGSGRGDSSRGNRAAYESLAFMPSTLVDTSTRNQQTKVFGRAYDSPFGVSPMGGTSIGAYQGDIAVARSVAAANIPMILSGASFITLERVKQAGPTAWFQAYIPGDDAVIARLVERVTRAGYETMVVTLDVTVPAKLDFSLRSGFRKPFHPTPRFIWDVLIRPRWLCGMFLRTLLTHGMPHVENMEPRTPVISRSGDRPISGLDQLSWANIDTLRRLWKGNLVLKGVLNKNDVKTAREAGVDGIIVSNHGGRQLDGAVAPLRVLPGIVAEAGDMTIMLDSGVRRGTDVLKALALGAKLVFAGRPFIYAAAVGGEAGVRHAIGILRDEIDRDMALLGITSLDQMTRDRLVPADKFDGLEF